MALELGAREHATSPSVEDDAYVDARWYSVGLGGTYRF
jgi:hypothetical protein